MEQTTGAQLVALQTGLPHARLTDFHKLITVTRQIRRMAPKLDQKLSAFLIVLGTAVQRGERV